MSKRTVWESSAAPEYGLLTCSCAQGTTRTCDPPLRSYLTRSSRLPASSFSTSSCCPSLSEPTGSESSGASRRVAPSPSSSSTARRTGRFGRCLWGCCERGNKVPLVSWAVLLVHPPRPA